jgi:hypothetical protein
MYFQCSFEGQQNQERNEEEKEKLQKKLDRNLFAINRARRGDLISLNVNSLKDLHDYILFFYLTQEERSSLLLFEFQTLLVETALTPRRTIRSKRRLFFIFIPFF